jgi:FkbM family methyltransferase
MISYSINFEDVILKRALRDVEIGFYIDVGASWPETHSVTKTFYDTGWRGINVEPLEGPYSRLVTDRTRDINLNCALGAENGRVRIWEPDTDGWATARPDIVEALGRLGHLGAFHDVKLRTLADVCEEYVSTNIHFLKIDVEGFEKEVILGGDFRKYRPWIVVVEATYPNSTRPSHQEWEFVLIKNGYLHVYFDGLNRFYVASEHQRLGEAFLCPPNVFDGFKTLGQYRAEVRVAELESQIRDLEIASVSVASGLDIDLRHSGTREFDEKVSEADERLLDLAGNTLQTTADAEYALSQNDQQLNTTEISLSYLVAGASQDKSEEVLLADLKACGTKKRSDNDCSQERTEDLIVETRNHRANLAIRTSSDRLEAEEAKKFLQKRLAVTESRLKSLADESTIALREIEDLTEAISDLDKNSHECEYAISELRSVSGWRGLRNFSVPRMPRLLSELARSASEHYSSAIVKMANCGRDLGVYRCQNVLKRPQPLDELPDFLATKVDRATKIYRRLRKNAETKHKQANSS